MRHIARLLIPLLLCCGVGLAAEPAKPEQGKDKVGLSFVALAKPKLPDPEQVRNSLQARLGATRISAMETAEKVIVFRVHGGTVMIGLLEQPLPKGEIDHACKWAWYWRTACDVMAPHEAHLLVTVMHTDLDRLGAALLQTKVVASLMDSNAIASYWGSSLQSKDAFLRQSAGASTDNLPVLLWINFRLTNDIEKGWTISTQGMEKFGLYEIESRDVNVDGRKLFGLIAGMAEYLIKKGPVIKDGETIGDSPAENIRVRHAPSYWREGETVYRVVFPQK
ncbi:MAG TPA: DUF4261 domain-containing protein [Ramlibacter sp.]|nr:DUF4261 domain-containing protein [Ramlibacter sp.]